jgi:hypothetical protein
VRFKSIVINRELEGWEGLASQLKETVDRNLFNQLLRAAHTYRTQSFHCDIDSKIRFKER